MWLQFQNFVYEPFASLISTFSDFQSAFCQNFLQDVSLYGVTAATFNVHQFHHLADNVRHLGPLWAHSAFAVECGNGRLVESVTAARGLPH